MTSGDAMAYTQLTAAQVLANIQTAFTNTFGNTVNLTPSSLNGVFIQQLADIGVSVEATRALLQSNIYDPNYASGAYLDGICAFSQITRRAASSSQVTCTCTGTAGTVIPIGSQIISTNNDIFTNTIAITIPSGGTINGVFESQSTGAIPCDANTVNRIVQTVPGWDTVNNASDGIIGSAAESDNNLRLRYKQSLYTNSAGSVNSIVTALEANSNITDYNIYENNTTSSVTVNGVTVNANSIYLCVNTSSDYYQDVAQILYLKKSAGCGMTGSETVTYTDPTYPWITYTTHFDVAAQVPIAIDVSILSSYNTNANTTTDIKNALINSFTGADGSTPVYMGTTFYASRFYAPIVKLGIYGITDLTIGLVSGTQGTEIALDFNQVATLEASNITITWV